MFSKRDLQVLLDDVKKEFSIKSSYSSTGPGYLDPWLLMQKRKNIWQHIEPVQAVRPLASPEECWEMLRTPLLPHKQRILAIHLLIWKKIKAFARHNDERL